MSSVKKVNQNLKVPNIKVEPEECNTTESFISNSSRSTYQELSPKSSSVSAFVSKAKQTKKYVPSSSSDYSSDDTIEDKFSSRKGKKKRKLADDGDFKYYESRIKALRKERAKLRLENILEDGTEFKKLDETFVIDGCLQIPKEMWDNLFEHQKTGVRWLWELHQLGVGGILGDEMGLGKTIQMIAFLTALRNSNLTDTHKGYEDLGPTVLVCPATVMHQWLQEFRKWWPAFRVAILHSSGTFTGKSRKRLVEAINKSKGILIVSYQGVVIYQDLLHALDWHYAILDEGHKIRNPDAQVTLACKRFRTPHRIILSGSPVQNNLNELWSIFDFIYPGKLGTLPVFMDQFAAPITQGGYANASDVQVQIAYKCSCILRDTIKPFLLRRTKAEVNNKLKLPEKSEQVLFCKLTEKQRKLYQDYLDSPVVRDIKRGFCQIFLGLIEMRKICNHPDLFDSTDCSNQIKQLKNVSQSKHSEFFSEDETFGHYKKSGKMMVVDSLLKLWKKQGHKVLLFTQSRQMLKMFIAYLKHRDYTHLYMDGTTPIGSRQTLIEEFNKNEEMFIFLLTTRVGGVGVNLTGANRIIIYDPDWNPSTDIQARERAWRIGQEREVIIYRLLSAGTIEEKIYHRQVFKLYLTNRILKNAKQKRFFKTNDLHELFTLGDNNKDIETNALFDENLQINSATIQRAKLQRKAKKKSKQESKHAPGGEPLLSEEKLKAMRDKVKHLSQMIALKYGSNNTAESDTQVRIKVEPCDTEIQETSKAIEPSCSSPSTSLFTRSIEDKQEKKHNIVNQSRKQHIKYLVRQDIYQPDYNQDKKVKTHNKHDDYILERLFKSSNVFGALKHDRIENDSTADYKVVESEAIKVAGDAIRALRESRRLCLGSSTGIPNWTGQNGCISKRPSLIPKNRSRIQTYRRTEDQSSSNADSLLSTIKKRNHANPIALDSDDEDREKDYEGKAEGTGAKEMACKIREFILFKSNGCGEAHTDELLAFFKNNFKSHKTAIFKAILYKMCEFQRRDGQGFWVMKSEFKESSYSLQLDSLC